MSSKFIPEIKPYSVTRTILGPFIKKHTDWVNGISNLPLNTPFLIASTHIDYFDGFYIAYHISEKTYKRVFFLSKTNNYFIYRSSIKVDKKNPDQSLNYASNVIRKGHSVCIFPEGKRNSEPNLLQGKTGIARLAMHTRLPLVPIGLTGPSGTSWTNSLKILIKNKEKMTMNIGKPVTYWEYYRKDATPDIINQITKHIMQSLAHLTFRKYPF